MGEGARRRDTDRRVVSAAVVGSVVAAAAMFAPWHRSGLRVRSGVELVSVADELGLVDGTAWFLARAGWLALPLLAAAAVAAAVLGRWLAAAVVAGVAGAVGLVVGVIGLGVPAAQWGPVLTTVAGALALGLAMFALLPRWRGR